MPSGRVRRLAASLALLALTLLPVRGLLACEMAGTSAEGADGRGAMVGGSHANHVAAGHGAHAAAEPQASDAVALEAAALDGAERSDPPAHPECDHVVGCAPVAIAARVARAVPGGEALPKVPAPLEQAVNAPERAVEPPPPRA